MNINRSIKLQTAVAFVSLFIFLTFSSSFLYSQTTIRLKPNFISGKDALIFNRIGGTEADSNYAHYPELNTLAWTWNSKPGTIRSLLCFNELSNIPSSAIVINSKLILYGLSSSSIAPQGNSYFVGSSSVFPENTITINRITSPWEEHTVTWNTQPTYSNSNQIVVPFSQSQWNWNCIIENSNELNSIIQDFVSNPNSNYGFLIKQSIEEKYRSLLFASSNHLDSLLWPELIVTYNVCNADFAFCGSNKEGVNYFTFEAFTSYLNSYTWTINDEFISSSQGFHAELNGNGTYEVCLTAELTTTICKKCITIIMEDNNYTPIIHENAPLTNKRQNKNSIIPKCDTLID